MDQFELFVHGKYQTLSNRPSQNRKDAPIGARQCAIGGQSTGPGIPNSLVNVSNDVNSSARQLACTSARVQTEAVTFDRRVRRATGLSINDRLDGAHDLKGQAND